jgi:hypothetical protein
VIVIARSETTLELIRADGNKVVAGRDFVVDYLRKHPGFRILRDRSGAPIRCRALRRAEGPPIHRSSWMHVPKADGSRTEAKQEMPSQS